MPSEKRTRIEFFLPIRSDSTDYQIITDWLAEELAYSRGGSTLTTPFTGLYISTSQANIVRDAVHILFCDFDLNSDNPDHLHELSRYLEDLRKLLMELLNEEEIWIVHYPLTRIVGS